MPPQNQLPLHCSNQYSAESACVYCEGIVRHESWCVTQSDNVHYAFQAVSNPNELSLGDHLILHALGVAWRAEGLRGSCRALKEGLSAWIQK
jgi:hypothetical protein